MHVLVVGSIALDTVTTPYGASHEALGGSAVYFSAAASQFTSKVRLVGVVGSDFPKKELQFIKKFGVDTSGLQQVSGKTFRWSGKYENLNEAITLDTQLNVFADFSPNLPESYRSSELVFLANIDPELQLSVLQQLDSPQFIALDTMNFWIQRKREALEKILQQVDALFINEEEMRMLTDETNIITAARKALELGPRIIVLKRGEYGSFILSEADYFMLPAYPLEHVVDTTGAGDSFAGGFMGFLASLFQPSAATFRKAAAYGTVLSSFTVSEFSLKGLENIPKNDIEKRFDTMKKITQF